MKRRLIVNEFYYVYYFETVTLDSKYSRLQPGVCFLYRTFSKLIWIIAIEVDLVDLNSNGPLRLKHFLTYAQTCPWLWVNKWWSVSYSCPETAGVFPSLCSFICNLQTAVSYEAMTAGLGSFGKTTRRCVQPLSYIGNSPLKILILIKETRTLSHLQQLCIYINLTNLTIHSKQTMFASFVN